jgi:predicted naringenin-chalcone synthase
MSYITSIGIANPRHKFKQSTIAEFMVKAMQLDNNDARKLKALYRATGIESRYSVLEDYGRQEDFDFYSNNENLEPFPSTSRRLELFRKHAANLSSEAAHACLSKIDNFAVEKITHLIVVSCTGMYAPGLDIDLVKELKLNPSVERTCINFMGCYAAFNAMKLADTFCTAKENAKVLVVCTELCSIHFQKENNEENWLANSLFADGSAALLVESSPRKGLNLKPEGFYCDLVIKGEQDMAWSVGDLGFEMRLSSYIPEMIRSGIKTLTQALLDKVSRQLKNVSYFAIHPGGKRILEVIEEELGMNKDQNRYAYEVLKNFGNMSSPTVLFVLNEICTTLNGVDNGKEILSFAFGPGLTLESMILRIENH